MESLDAIVAAAQPGDPIQLEALDYEIRTPCLRSKTELKLVGRGPATRVFGLGGDVFNLDRCGDVEIGHMSLHYVGPHKAINGISITNGSGRIYVRDVVVDSMPGVPLETRYDGGKAFTLQPAQGISKDVVFERCGAQGCPVGFGADAVGDGCVLQVVKCWALHCNLALSLSAANDTSRFIPTTFGARVACLSVGACSRLAIVSRWSNTWLQDVVTVRTPAVTSDPFVKYWGGRHLVQREAKNVVIRRMMLNGDHFISLVGMDALDVVSNGSKVR